MLYSTGIRRMEIADLAKSYVNPARVVLAARQGKGEKDRFVPTSNRAMDWVISPGPGQVFLEPTGQPIPLDC